MSRLYQMRDDFEGLVRILTEREAGRRTPAFNGIRWDLRYFHEPDDQLSMVWPEFLDEAGETLSMDKPLAGLIRARFYIVAEGMRPFHRQYARPGTGFFCVEGRRVCAAGVITRITGLAEDGTT